MIKQLASTAAAVLFAGSAWAGSIVIGTGDYNMTDFDPVNAPDGTLVQSVASPIEGLVEFTDKDGNPHDMVVQQGDDWWAWDDGSYTTDLYWVELVMPANTRAFSFSLAAEKNSRAWIEVFDSEGNSHHTGWFGLGPDNSRDFAYSVETGSCSSLTRIVIDPVTWGTGDFAINQDTCTTEVPEPSSAWLIGVGLLALIVARKRAAG